MKNILFFLLLFVLCILGCREETYHSPPPELTKEERWADEEWCAKGGWDYDFEEQRCAVPEGYVLDGGALAPLDRDDDQYFVRLGEDCLCQAYFLCADFTSSMIGIRIEGVSMIIDNDLPGPRFEIELLNWAAGSDIIPNDSVWATAGGSIYNHFLPCTNYGYGFFPDSIIDDDYQINGKFVHPDTMEGIFRFYREAPEGDSLVLEECDILFYR